MSKDWFGRVWINPPYSRPLIEMFVKKMADHGNGIELLFNRCDSKMFQDVIFEKATEMKFLRTELNFLDLMVPEEIPLVVEASLLLLVKTMRKY